MQRRHLLKNGALASCLLAIRPHTFFPSAPQERTGSNPPYLAPQLIRKFIKAAHRDMETVKALLKEYPTLLNAAYDWKGGDFETALGAASHVGHKVMAQYLMDQGAQFNIFTACLFGRMDIVKPVLDFSPDTLYAKGPHGFTLLHHAKRGGDEALEVKEYLLRLGAKEMKVLLY
ncbi:MAG: ankyrin repeat domain-containing protein [Bacteroidota bacterium]